MGRIGRTRVWAGKLWFFACLAGLVLRIFVLSQAQSVSASPPEADVDRYLDEKERQVIEIANAATANYEIATELVTTCGGPGNCSRGICNPVDGELQELSCAQLVNNSNCSPGPGSLFCDSGLVTYKRSYVRFPLSQLTGLPPEVINAVCVQRNLDTLFRKFHPPESSEAGFSNSKLASIDGTQRFYPGRELKDCIGTYDPRRRPWYAGAISVKKRLAILLDNGQSMSKLGWTTPSTSLFTITQNITSALLRTLTPNDVASIALFSSGPNATQLNATVSVPETGLDATFSLLQPVDDELGAQTVSPLPGVSNVTAGLAGALPFLNSADADALKVLVIFTDGTFGDELISAQLNPVLHELKTSNVVLLVFVIPIVGASNSACHSTSFQNLVGLCGNLPGNMSVEVLTEVKNPLFGLRNLFSFFARTHLHAVEAPLWQSQYTNYDNLGESIDVSYPAMTAKNQLIGVASIGIQVSGLSQSIRGSLGKALVRRARSHIINPSGVDLLCQPEEDTFANSRSDSSGITGVCSPTRHPPSFLDLSCCQQCGGRKRKTPTFSKGARAAVISAAAVVGVVVLLFALWWFWELPPPPPPKLLKMSTATK